MTIDPITDAFGHHSISTGSHLLSLHGSSLSPKSRMDHIYLDCPDPSPASNGPLDFPSPPHSQQCTSQGWCPFCTTTHGHDIHHSSTFLPTISNHHPRCGSCKRPLGRPYTTRGRMQRWSCRNLVAAFQVQHRPTPTPPHAHTPQKRYFTSTFPILYLPCSLVSASHTM